MYGGLGGRDGVLRVLWALVREWEEMACAVWPA